ncbi:hypothetical protein E4634_02980 [Mangrovimicrobium sediminis]|uniref:DUF1214 domain-containing protein n=1 Tax=Mangrovimicrobium sediminis TaxID=2562682 RepID=A0A4Z0M8Y5_9GAMM|nr:hypothetical protein [Haliea sp. SAOS-164]TGD75848.1 hypothetical protein E4634_02980 [Haliea sp. SAOS-164]
MSDNDTTMAQTNFASRSQSADSAADFSSDAGALAYANRQLDELVAAMRYKLEKHITGWPGDDRELDTHEALRHLLRDISFGHAAYMEADYANPNLTKMSGTSRVQFQLPSPDCVYHSAVLHGDYRYRLRGNRGSACVFQLTVYSGHACDLVGWKTQSMINNFDAPEQLAPEREVEIVLSRERPADLGNALWLELPEGPCELHSRQYYADWQSEKPADLVLTVDDQPFPAQLLDRPTAETRFHRLVDLLRVHTDFYRAGVQAHLDADPVEIAELKIPGAFEGTNYFPGHFRCQPDQAVIIETDDPDSLYWNTALFQMQYEPGDWWARMSSLNGQQVHTDADGKIRIVCSWQDPGVPNWLDASGRVLHLIAYRFFRAARTPAQPRLTTVPLAEVRAHLPANTPTVTPAERRALLERRLVSVYRRRCGDF